MRSFIIVVVTCLIDINQCSGSAERTPGLSDSLTTNGYNNDSAKSLASSALESAQSSSVSLGSRSHQLPRVSRSLSNRLDTTLSSTSALGPEPVAPQHGVARRYQATSGTGCPGTCQCTYRPDNTVELVDCSSKGLKEIPSLPSSASEIYLQNNTISDIRRASFRHLGTLRILDLSQNKLERVRNETFQGLSRLVSLSLRVNLLHYTPGTFETRAFNALTSLESLHLEGNQPHLPDNFVYPDQALAQIPTLKNLWLDGYPRPLGPGFSSLVNLSYICFTSYSGGFCTMDSDMPSTFFYHLATKQPLRVNMTRCFIKVIPPTVFKYVPTIHTLDLYGNKDLSIDGFESASKGLQGSNLTVLNISHIVVPFPVESAVKNTTFRHLKSTNLKCLVVEDCKLEYIDLQAIMDLPNTLEYLSFRFNFVRQFHFWTGLLVLRNLKVLRISHQGNTYKIQTYHVHPHYTSPRRASIEKMRKLAGRMNQGSHNQASLKTENASLELTAASPIHHQDFFRNSPVLPNEYRSSIKNSYIPLPISLEKLFAKEIATGGTSMSSFSFNITNNTVLNYVDLSNNGLISFTGLIFGVPSLQYLDFSGNRCRHINRHILSTVPNIKTLRLHNNRLGRSLATDRAGVIFSYASLLEELDLSYNLIKNLSHRTFDANKRLQFLNLSNNALSHFRPSLHNNAKLQLLDLSNNLLHGFSEATCRQMLHIKGRNSNFTVRITGNTFSCNCDNFYFLYFLLDHPEIFDDVNTFQCKLENGLSVGYTTLAHFLPHLGLQCLVQSIFIGVLIAFFVMSGTVMVFALYHYKRWQWKYLHYISKQRLHIGSTYLTHSQAAHAFLTYDQVRHSSKRGLCPLFGKVVIFTVILCGGG